jgi:hypothetical protein
MCVCMYVCISKCVYVFMGFQAAHPLLVSKTKKQ